MYAVWIKIDGTLPWIELKGAFETRSEARKAAEDFRNSLQMKIVSTPEERRPIRALAAVKST